jgi:hypothetical protein
MSNVNAIAALLPIPDEKQRRRCLRLCLQKVRWYQRMRDLDAQQESPADAREALADLTTRCYR